MKDDTIPAVTPDLPSRGWRMTLGMLRRMPQGVLSRGFGRLADAPIPRGLRQGVLGSFARAVGIDVQEAELPIAEYTSLNNFFARRLKPGVRTWPTSDRVAGSPVEAIVGQLGQARNGSLLQAKGRWYSAFALLDDESEAQRYDGGAFITLYLSPRHYHRIHAPVTATIPKARHVPGYLLPVNSPSVTHVENLFAVNERLICYLDSMLGRIAIVAIGAYNVGRISTAFDPEWSARGWVTNRRPARPESKTYTVAPHVKTGDEIMAFHLGSTVVVLFERNRAQLLPGIEPGMEMRLGQPIVSAIEAE
ncbi:MAG: archaetidylserine decarboxylase [Gemmatimonadota bacterium]